MKKHLEAAILISSLVFLCGFINLQDAEHNDKRVMLCRSTLAGIINANNNDLQNLSIGMSKDDVLNTMDKRTLTAHQNSEAITITNPYRDEILHGKDNKSFEILYYVTMADEKDYRITEDKLTPLIFEDNKLIGIGWGFLQELKKNNEVKP